MLVCRWRRPHIFRSQAYCSYPVMACLQTPAYSSKIGTKMHCCIAWYFVPVASGTLCHDAWYLRQSTASLVNSIAVRQINSMINLGSIRSHRLGKSLTSIPGTLYLVYTRYPGESNVLLHVDLSSVCSWYRCCMLLLSYLLYDFATAIPCVCCSSHLN